MQGSHILLPLVQQCQQRRFKQGMLLIQEGDSAGPLYILLSGRLRAFSYDLDGKEVTFGTYSPVDLIGEMSIDGGPRSASVITEETCECAIMPLDTFKAQLLHNSELSMWLVTRLIQRARAATDATRNLALLDVYGRLKYFLETEVFTTLRENDNGPRLKITHQTIASRVGASREMISKLLKDLETGGYIEVVERRISKLQPLPRNW